MFFKLFTFVLLLLFQNHVNSTITTTGSTQIQFEDKSGYTSTGSNAIPVEVGFTVSGLTNPLPATASITLQIWLTHKYNYDLIIRLYSPIPWIVISNQRGSYFADVFNGTLFTDSAPNSVSTYNFNSDGVVTPLKSEQLLANFIGNNLNGAWKLWIQDTISNNHGSIRKATLTINGKIQIHTN